MTPEELQAIRDRATRLRRTVPLVLDGALQERIEALEEERTALTGSRSGGRLSSRPAGRVAEIDQELGELHDRAEAATMHVVIEGMPSTAWHTLFASYPPRKAEDGTVLAGDKFFGADTRAIREPAVRRCAIGYRDGESVVPFADDTLNWLLGHLTDGQMDKLVDAAVTVNRGDDAVPPRRSPSTTTRSDDA